MLDTFGRVPLFYYLLHIPLIHAMALVVWYLRDGAFGAERFRRDRKNSGTCTEVGKRPPGHPVARQGFQQS